MDQTAKKSFNPLLIVGAVVLLGVVGIGIVMAGNKGNNPQSTQMTQDEEQSAAGQTNPVGSTTNDTPDTPMDMENTEVRVIDVEAGSFYFKPNEIRVKKGEKVKIVLTSVSMMHDFVIDELNVKMPIVQNGNTGTVEFTADQAGTFEYYCSVGQHRANGQVGTLIVEE